MKLACMVFHCIYSPLLVWGGSLSQPVIGYKMDYKPILCCSMLQVSCPLHAASLPQLNALRRLGGGVEGCVHMQGLPQRAALLQV